MSNFSILSTHSFQVEILGVTDGSSPEYFYKVEGLQHTLSVEAYLPGGANRPYFKPKACETVELVLARPLIKGKTKITVWCENSIDTLVFKLTQAHILVLNREANIVAQWTIEDVYPKGIAIAPFQVHDPSTFGVGETITLGYSRLVRTK